MLREKTALRHRPALGTGLCARGGSRPPWGRIPAWAACQGGASGSEAHGLPTVSWGQVTGSSAEQKWRARA